MVHNKGWGDISEKIVHFLGEASNYKFKKFSDLQKKPFKAAAEISRWPLQQVEDRTSGGTKDFLAKCLVGCFNDPFNSRPNPEVIQKWFLTRWKVTAGLRITPIAHNKFLFELPSKQEATRVKAGDWYWNG